MKPTQEEQSLPAGISIWLITDEKPGHQNQLRGLANALQKLTKTKVYWFPAKQFSGQWQSFWSGSARKKIRDTVNETHPNLDSPTAIISAGHSTHSTLLALSNIYQTKSILLMSPTLPYKMFDAVIVPEHDNPPRSKHILKTKGVINKIQPRQSDKTTAHGLILIGGDSKHYQWQEKALINQILEVIGQSSHPFIISTSRRTPTDFKEILTKKIDEKGFNSKVKIFSPDETSEEWLQQTLNGAIYAWVTPDSVSMLYESITSGAPTAIFHLKAKKHSRIIKGIETLEQDKLITTWAEWQQSRALKPLPKQFCEADRAAKWLVSLLKIETNS